MSTNKVKIVAVHNKELDIRKYVRALIQFAREDLQVQAELEQANRRPLPAMNEESDG